MRLDAYSIRPLGTDDFDVVQPVLAAVPAGVFQVPRAESGFRSFVGGLSRRPWALPFACFENRTAAGLCFMNVGQLKHLNAYLVALFLNPSSAALPLALYIRHAFWSFPLHRLYAHVPASAAAQPYVAALLNTGFKQEGVLVAHIANGDAPADVIVFGLLRDEFGSWCRDNEPRLYLR